MVLKTCSLLLLNPLNQKRWCSHLAMVHIYASCCGKFWCSLFYFAVMLYLLVSVPRRLGVHNITLTLICSPVLCCNFVAFVYMWKFPVYTLVHYAWDIEIHTVTFCSGIGQYVYVVVILYVYVRISCIRVHTTLISITS